MNNKTKTKICILKAKIKGEKQLVDLAESGKFMTSKFDVLEKDRKEKEKIINNLKGKVSYSPES